MSAGRPRNCDRQSALPLVNSSPMENAMCWEMDYQFFAEQKKAQEKQENKIKENQAREEQRDKVIAKLLDAAKVQSETEESPVKEVTPAK